MFFLKQKKSFSDGKHNFIVKNCIITLYNEPLGVQDGSRFQKDFKFDGKLVCGEPAPPILATRSILLKLVSVFTCTLAISGY